MKLNQRLLDSQALAQEVPKFNLQLRHWAAAGYDGGIWYESKVWLATVTGNATTSALNCVGNLPTETLLIPQDYKTHLTIYEWSER